MSGIFTFPEAYLNDLEVGSIIPWPDAGHIPAGFSQADGGTLSRTAYPEAFDRFGEDWGAGDGSTTFNKPSLPIDTLPWNLPRGRVGYAAKTTNTTLWSGTDVPGLSVTVNLVAGRRYRISSFLRLAAASVAADRFVHIRDGSNNEIQIEGNSIVLNGQATFNPSVIVTPAVSGSMTYKISTNVTSGTVTLVGGAEFPAYIMVEDIGADTTQAPWSQGCWLIKVKDTQPSLAGQSYEVVSSSTNPDGASGKMIFESDTDKLKLHNGVDYVEALSIGQWTNYTPVVTQSNTVSATVNYARYSRIGRTITVQANISVTGDGTSGQPIRVTLPVPAAYVGALGTTIGIMEAYDASATTVYGGGAWLGGTTEAPYVTARHMSNNGVGNTLGTGTANFALASGDFISFSVTYEAAS